MDERRFDTLAKTIATGGTRRSFLRSLAAVVGAVVAGGLRQDAAMAACKPDSKQCNQHHQCCSGYCNPATGACGQGVEEPRYGCKPNHQPCNKDDQCCSGSCNPTTGTCESWVGDSDNGCTSDDQGCDNDSQCCSGYCNPTTEICGQRTKCKSNADCDDGNPCTYDVCGSLTRRCYHDPIPNCVPCSAGCGDGSCCDGRCCPVGSICSFDEMGRETCCDPCGETECCDVYREDALYARNCVEGCGFCCNGGNGECEIDANGTIVNYGCVLPGNAR
jgi:hypothetical protein